MANTFIKIETINVGAGGATVLNFSSIPNTFDDLCIKLSLRNTATGSPRGWAFVRFNSDSSSIYDERMLYTTNGTSPGGATNLNGTEFSWNAVVGGSATANVFGNNQIYVPNYLSSSSKRISIDFVTENNGTEVAIGLHAGIWRSNSAITSISITGASSTTLAEYSSATLYGIKSS